MPTPAEQYAEAMARYTADAEVWRHVLDRFTLLSAVLASLVLIAVVVLFWRLRVWRLRLSADLTRHQEQLEQLSEGLQLTYRNQRELRADLAQHREVIGQALDAHGERIHQVEQLVDKVALHDLTRH